MLWGPKRGGMVPGAPSSAAVACTFWRRTTSPNTKRNGPIIQADRTRDGLKCPAVDDLMSEHVPDQACIAFRQQNITECTRWEALRLMSSARQQETHLALQHVPTGPEVPPLVAAEPNHGNLRDSGTTLHLPDCPCQTPAGIFAQ